MLRQDLPAFFKDETSQLPFFQNFQKEMEHVLDRFRSPPATTLAEMLASANGQLIPALDIAETDDEIEISAEIPGVTENELDVSVSGGVLTLKGEKNSHHEESEKDYHLVERRYGSFRRQIPLGFTPDNGAVEANFSDGILRLKIKKPADAKAAVQKIEISKK